MKIQIVVDIPNISTLSSEELDGIREAIGIVFADDMSFASARVAHIEVSDE
jgi:hypothetical protein